MPQQRKKIWIDRFQTILSWRIACYFILYQAALGTFVVIDHYFVPRMQVSLGATISGKYFLLLVVSSVTLGGLFIYDGIQLAHRIVGPLYRFRQVMKAIAAGEEVDLIRLRKGDFLLDMRDDFNEMIKALEQRGAVTLKPPASKNDKRETLPV
jgi:hypothetical protein